MFLFLIEGMRLSLSPHPDWRTGTAVPARTRKAAADTKGFLRDTFRIKTAASANDAGFFEAEIAAASRGRGANDDVINQLKLKNSAGFERSSREADIRFRRIRVTAGVIMDHHEAVGRMENDGLKDFASVGERLIHSALAHGSDFDQMLLGVKENNAE